MGKGINGLIVGAAIGIAIGVLCAPRAGKETREKLFNKGQDVLGPKAQEEGTILGEVAKTTKTAVEAGQHLLNVTSQGKVAEVANEVKEKGQKIFKETSQKGQKFIEDTTAFVEDFANDNVRPIFSEKNEELRKKIDNARTKIASQVAHNIKTDTEGTFAPYDSDNSFTDIN